MGAPPCTRGSLCGAGSPCASRCRRSARAWLCHARHPGDFLAKRKSPKIRQEPPGSWTSGEGGVAPFDPPVLCPSGIGCDSLNPQASPKPTLPRHGLTAEGVTPGKAWGETKTDLPTNPKWQIGLGQWQKVARHETERSAASAKRAVTPHRGIPKGAALGAPLVTFPATGKSPGVGGAERPPLGGVGVYPHFGECRGAQPLAS